MNASERKLVRQLEHDRDRLLVALVRATEQGVQRFTMENAPTLFHSFISAWENAFPLLVEFGVARECESDVEIMVDEAKVNAIEDRIDKYDPEAILDAGACPHGCEDGEIEEQPHFDNAWGEHGLKRTPCPVHGKPSAEGGEL